MHKILVEEKKWIDEDRFLHALNYCMLLPGPEAQQLATYVGWILHKFKGGLTAGILFVMPGFLSILALSILYALFQETNFIQSLFFGLKAAVLAVVIEAVIKIGKKALKNNIMYIIAALAFIAIFFFDVPFPLIILLAGLTGFIGGKLNPDKFYVIKPNDNDVKNIDVRIRYEVHKKPTISYVLKIILIFGSLWLIPVMLLLILLGENNVFVQQAIFFSKTAVVTFGGAYSILAYISQEAVKTYGWLGPGEMLDGLGMAETTPGPLIQVVQFVGFMGAFKLAEGLNPVTSGVIASFITTWVTYVPCFLWIFLGAPFIENLRNVKWLTSVLSSITAAVVGVILNLALWFFLHSVFADVDVVYFFSARIYKPDFLTADPAMLLIAASSFIVMFKYKISMIKTLAGAMLIGFLYSYFFSPA